MIRSHIADPLQSSLNAAQVEAVHKLAQQFETATGIACMVIGMDEPSASSSTHCCFCRRAAAMNVMKDRDCGAVHRYGIYQSERFGGRYIYFCSCNMTHWVVPLMLDGRNVASFIAGPVLQIDPDEYLQEEVAAKNKTSPAALAELRTVLREIPFVEAKRITALSELLYRAATGLSSEFSMERPDRSLETRQKSKIAEYIHELKKSSHSIVSYPIEKERELLSLISKGDKHNAQKVLNDIIGHILFSSGNNVAVIRIRIQELIVILSRAVLEGGASVEEVFGLNDRYLLQLQQMNHVNDIADWLSEILQRFSDCVFNLKLIKHADVIRKAVHFMNANYTRKIVLQDVADHVYMSASYFSKIFNEEMGVSVSEYIRKVRVEKSKILLRESSSSLSEIATMVGFDDQSYFTKIFRKYTNQSPGIYRRNRGRSDNRSIEILE